MRVVDMDKPTALKLCNVKKGTYNTWCNDPEFTALYRRRDELCGLYKQEAMQLLRRDNQLAAVLLEAKIIEKMKEEIEAGFYELVRTNLAKEVYSKLIADLDVVPQAVAMTWQNRIEQLNVVHDVKELPETIEGVIVDVKED